MQNITYSVPVVAQGTQDCVQASALEILSFYGITKSINDVKSEVPVYVDSEGKPLGSSLGHIASYFLDLHFDVTIHSVDVEIFDRSWSGRSSEELITKLGKRQKYLKHSRYDQNAIDQIIDGYQMFLRKGGHVVFPIIDTNYVYALLEQGPIYAVLSYNFLNQVSKYANDISRLPIQDDITGSPSTHVVIISGYKDGQFSIADPDPAYGGLSWISESLLIASIYLAETDLDPMLITLIEPNKL